MSFLNLNIHGETVKMLIINNNNNNTNKIKDKMNFILTNFSCSFQMHFRN